MKSAAVRRLKPNAQRAAAWLWSLVRALILIGLCFAILQPLFIKALKGFMSPNDLYDPTVLLYPRDWNTYFYRHAYDLIDYWGSLWNTLVPSLLSAVIQMFVCTLVGYGFARFPFRGKNVLFALVLVTILVPPQLYSTSLYMHFRFFGAFGLEVSTIDTNVPYIVLSLVGLGFKNGLYIYLLRQFFRGMPKELEEAAYIDGYGPFRTFFAVMLPNARNMLVTVLVLSFSWQWMDVFYATLFHQNVKTLSLAILNNITLLEDATQYTILRNTAGLLAMLPLVLLFIVAQKQIISGIERSGIVG